MRLRLTKMHGVGNDFVVLDGTCAPTKLSRLQLRGWASAASVSVPTRSWPSSAAARRGVDFRHSIYNGASGDEVEHCGNGARCFVRYVHGRGLTDKTGPSVSQPVSQPAQPSQPRAMADATIFQRAVLARMDRRGYTLR